MYHAVTRKIEVNVSRASCRSVRRLRRPFFWGYTVEIPNLGDEEVQLKTRHWKITDASGRSRRSRAPAWWARTGPRAGRILRIYKRRPAADASGIMAGTYGMVTQTGDRFDIEVPAFSLDGPESKRTLN